MVKHLKLFKYLSFLFKCKLVFKNPKKKDLLVFDDESYLQIKNLVKKYDHEVLVVRKENLDTVCISLKIILLTFYYYRGNLFTSYIISLIVLSKPKIVFTFIDNSFKFSEIAKSFKKIDKKIKFIALQNGARYEPLEYNYLYKKRFSKINNNNNFYLPLLLSFGLYEKDLYKKSKINVLNVVPVGNIRLESYILHKKKVKMNLKKKRQICLLSEHDNWHKEVELKNKSFTKNFYKVFNFTLRYALEEKIKIIICSKRHGFENKNDFSSPYYKEKKAYEDYVDYQYKIFFRKNLVKRNRDKFQTYKYMDESSIVVGSMSTLLRENLVLKNKIFACNTSKNNIYDFPLKEFFTANDVNYVTFKKKMSFLLNMSKNDFYNKIDHKINYLMINEKSTTKLIQLILDSELRST